MKKIVAIIGDSKIEAESEKYKTAFSMGKVLVDNGFRVQSGGLGGVMKAAFEGAHSSVHYMEGDTIAIVPSFDRASANLFADIVIPSGLDIMRNAIVANADAVIAIGGGAGTLSEMAIAWELHRLIIAFSNVEGWSAELSERKIDKRERYREVEDKVFGVQNTGEAIKILKKYIDTYNKTHRGIK